MAFTIREFDEIVDGTGNEDGFVEPKASLRGEHRAATTAELLQPRRHQVQFIDKSRN